MAVFTKNKDVYILDKYLTYVDHIRALEN